MKSDEIVCRLNSIKFNLENIIKNNIAANKTTALVVIEQNIQYIEDILKYLNEKNKYNL